MVNVYAHIEKRGKGGENGWGIGNSSGGSFEVWKEVE